LQKTSKGSGILSGALRAAVKGFCQVADADQGKGVADFTSKGSLWKKHRAKSKDSWVDYAIMGARP